MNITWGLIGAVVGVVVLTTPMYFILRRHWEQKVAELKAEGKEDEAEAMERRFPLTMAWLVVWDGIAGFLFGALALPQLMGN